MLAIVLGYTVKGSQAPPTVLYAGRDASAADEQSLTPPPGIVRTELIKHPVIQRRREFPDNLAAPELIDEESPELPPAKPSKAK